MAFNKFFSWKGQTQRIGNVFNTYKKIGANLISGKFFKGVNVAPKFKGSALGKFAGFISSPATVIMAPAAAGAIRVAAPLILPSIGGAVKGLGAGAGNVLKAGGRLLGTAGARKAVGTGLIAYGGFAGLSSLSRTFEKGGAGGLISGSGTTLDTEPRDTTIIETTDPRTGGTLKITSEGDQVPGGSFYQLPNGEIVPFAPGEPLGSGSAFSFPDAPFTQQGSGVIGWLPIAAVAFGVYIFSKKR